MMIELRRISRVYDQGGRDVFALRDVSMDVEKGQFVAVVGPSGSGKSTLMQIIGCLDSPTGGEYVLDGRAVATLDDAALSRIRNERIGFIFQGFNLIARTTAVENVELPMYYGESPPDRGRALALLARVGMSHRAGHFPNQLSGGEQQRVAIARALICSPALLIADEPTGNLDEATAAEILDLLVGLHRDGLTIVLVTHDPVVANRAERTIALRDGEIANDSVLLRPSVLAGSERS